MKSELLQQLERPFEPATITWKPGSIRKDGTAALALAYGDLRAYMERLDEVCDMGWSVSYTPWGDRIICNLTIDGITRSSTGEPDKESERGEIAGTVAEAQAFKRACAMFGVGRYLYKLPSIWADWDANRKEFASAGRQKLAAMLDRHYKEWQAKHQTPVAQHRTARDPDPKPTVVVSSGAQLAPAVDVMEELQALGLHHHGEAWPQVLSEWMTAQNVDELSISEVAECVEFMRAWGILPDRLTGSLMAPGLAADVQMMDGASDGLDIWGRIQAELTGNERQFVNWAMQKQEASTDRASDAQYGLVARRLDDLTGKQHGAVLSVLVGRPVSKDAPIGKALAGGLLDLLSKQSKDRASGEWVDNPKYAPKYEAAVKNIAAAALAAMGAKV